MENGADHIAVGALTGVAMACYGQHKREPVKPLLTIGASTVFSKLPDWIEPATNPHHRQFFHSISFLVVLGYSLKTAYDWCICQSKSAVICRCFVPAFNSFNSERCLKINHSTNRAVAGVLWRG